MLLFFITVALVVKILYPLLFKAKLDALPDEAEVVISARVDKSGRIRPERTESEKKRDDIEALVRAEREDLGNRIKIFRILNFSYFR